MKDQPSKICRNKLYSTFLPALIFLAIALIDPIQATDDKLLKKSLSKRVLEASASRMIVANNGFELKGDGGIPEWSWWTREEDAGSAKLTDEVAHSGSYSVFIYHDGLRDFAFSNASRFHVHQGQKLTASAWIKCEKSKNSIRLAAVALKDGEVVHWEIGSDRAYGTVDWTNVKALINVPDGVDQIYLRFVGGGNVRAWVDDVKIESGWEKRARIAKLKVKGFASERVK